MNKMFLILATLLAASTLIPSANAVGDSAIAIQGLSSAPRLGGIAGSVGPFQVGGAWVYTCTACTFDVVFDEIRVYGEATVNAQGELLVAGTTYTISDFTGTMIVQRVPNTSTWELVIAGSGTIN